MSSGARSALRTFALSRVAIWIVAVYAWIWFLPGRQGTSDPYVRTVWLHGDAAWFVGIAQHGYQRNGGEVFYPLYPLLLAGVARVIGHAWVAAGILVSLAACATAFVLLHRLAARLIGEDGARRTVLYLAVFPMSLFLQAPYSEALYLLLAVATFLLAEDERWLPAATAAGLATLTRIAGVALLPPLLWMAWRSPDRRRALVSLVAVPVLAALYPLWLQLRLHAPRSEFSNEAGWNRHFSHAGPLGGLWQAARATWAGIEQLATASTTHRYWNGATNADPLYVAAHNLEDVAFFVLFAVLGVVAWRRLGAPYALFVLGSLLIPLTFPAGGYPLLSMPRFTLVLFPAFIAGATLTSDPRRERAVLGLSALLLGVAVVQWSAGYWVS
jgi:Dolichyl-phosphate-mannose-protein mannosyltransferase